MHEKAATPPATADTTADAISTTDSDRAIVITIAGAVDYGTAPRIRAVVLEALGQLQDRLLVLDLARVQFFGTAGISTLVETMRAADQAEKCPALRIVVDASRQVIRPIQIAGLDGMLALFPTVQDALAAA